MPTTKAHKTRHHSNLRPKHKQSKKYLQTYWPYIPLMLLLLVATVLLQPWSFNSKQDVLPYATSMSDRQLLEATNSQRDLNNAPQLTLNKQLARAAQAKAQDMAKRNYWSHNTPDGQAPWYFIERSGYNYYKAGENLAYGFPDGNQVVAGWMNSETHRNNMLDPSYEDVGFGFADNENFDSNGPATIVVAMYATDEQVAGVDSQDTPAGFNSLASFDVEPNAQTISKVQTFTGGSWPWSSYLIGFLVGALAMFLVVKHGIAIKKMVVEGEKFLIAHPLLDVTIIAFIVVGVLLIAQAGVIL